MKGCVLFQRVLYQKHSVEMWWMFLHNRKMSFALFIKGVFGSQFSFFLDSSPMAFVFVFVQELKFWAMDGATQLPSYDGFPHFGCALCSGQCCHNTQHVCIDLLSRLWLNPLKCCRWCDLALTLKGEENLILHITLWGNQALGLSRIHCTFNTHISLWSGLDGKILYISVLFMGMFRGGEAMLRG